MIFEAENIDVVRQIIEGDIYYTSGVVSCISVSIGQQLLIVLAAVGQGQARHPAVGRIAAAIRPAKPDFAHLIAAARDMHSTVFHDDLVVNRR